MQKPVFVLDGMNFSTLEEFYSEVERVLIPGAAWGRNLDALNDIYRGGCGTPEGGFVIRRRNSSRSMKCMGYPETVRQLQSRMIRCLPADRDFVAGELEQAKQGIGSTVFDWLTAIVREHGVGGQEAEDGVELLLE